MKTFLTLEYIYSYSLYKMTSGVFRKISLINTEINFFAKVYYDLRVKAKDVLQYCKTYSHISATTKK